MRTKLFLIFSLLSIFCVAGFAQAEFFITIWDTTKDAGVVDDNPISDNQQIMLPLGSEDTDIEWSEVSNPSNSGSVTKVKDNQLLTFPNSGLYEIKLITNNRTKEIKFAFGNDSTKTDCRKLIEVTQWGSNSKWKSSANIFYGCANMDITATDIPGLTGNMQAMFYGCKSLVFNSSIGSWDMSTVDNLSNMFRDAVLFNQDITDWNVSSVTNFSSMFAKAANFNQAVGKWTLSSGVTSFAAMFQEASSFNQDVSSWNVSNATNLTSVFYKATSFNQSLATWIFNTAANPNNLISQTAVSKANYDATLAGWAANLPTATGTNKIIGVKDLYYSSSSVAYRNAILAKGWTLNGDVLDPYTDIDFTRHSNNYKIFSSSTGITILVNDDTVIEVYEISGKLIDKSNVNSEYSKALHKGVYLIRINGETVKYCL